MGESFIKKVLVKIISVFSIRERESQTQDLETKS